MKCNLITGGKQKRKATNKQTNKQTPNKHPKQNKKPSKQTNKQTPQHPNKQINNLEATGCCLEKVNLKGIVTVWFLSICNADLQAKLYQRKERYNKSQL